MGDAKSPLYQSVMQCLEIEPYTVVALPDTGAKQETIAAFIRDHNIAVVLDLSVFDIELPANCVAGAEALSLAAAEAGIAVIYLSSHEVFGGENKTIYHEEDLPAPTTAVGQRIWDAERGVQLNVEKHLILRLSWLTASSSDNVFTRLLNLLIQPKELRVSSDLRGAPTFTEDAARIVIALLKQVLVGAENWGVFHYASSDPCTEFEFAEYLSQVLVSQDRAVAEVLDVGTGEFEPSAVLSCRRCRDDFGVQQRSWRQGLEGRVRTWLKGLPTD